MVLDNCHTMRYCRFENAVFAFKCKSYTLYCVVHRTQQFGGSGGRRANNNSNDGNDINFHFS